MKRWQWFVAVMVCLLGAVAQAAPFYASKDGSMVWDEATGLVWARCSLGQTWTGRTCAGDASKHTFEDAQAAAKRLNAAGGLGGAKDWVVPAIRQLVSLRACSTGLRSDLRDLQDGGEPVPEWCAAKPVQPTIDPIAFPGTSVNVNWSSSAAAGEDAWGVDLGDGDAGNYGRSYQGPVRVVRAGQWLGGEAALAFPLKLTTTATQADWAQAVEAKDAADKAAKRAALQKTIAAGAQAMYLQAAQKQRSGDTTEAGRLYELIMEHYSKDPFAVKAADQLTALMGVSRTESAVRGAAERSAQAQRQSADALRDADRNASSRAACFSQIRSCEALCRRTGGRNENYCIGGCDRSCN